MTSFLFILLSFSSFLLFSSLFASSDPLTGCISNGHYYEVVTGSWTWDQAVTAASLMQYDGMTGYLATITSEEENIFIRGLLEPGPGNHHWLGGSAVDDTSSPSSYQWATGPENGTTFFQPPATCLGAICDFDGSLTGTFQRLSMIISPSVDGWEVLSSSTVSSYMVVEYGGLCVDMGMTDCVCAGWVDGCFLGGHHYELKNSGTGWKWGEAKIAAEGDTYMALSGYLATITNIDESTYAKGLLPYKAEAWLGATSVSSTTFEWKVGPEVGDVFPDNDPDCLLASVYCDWGTNTGGTGGLMLVRDKNTEAWSDKNVNGNLKYYIVEFDSGCVGPISGTPSPSSSRSMSLSRSLSKTRSASISRSSSRSLSISFTKTTSPSRSFSVSRSVSKSLTPSKTFTSIVTPTISPSNSRSLTPSVTLTKSQSRTPSISLTKSGSLTSSTSPSKTPTGSVSLTPTKTPSETPTSSVTLSVTSTVSPSTTFTPTGSLSLTPTKSPSDTPTPSGTVSTTISFSPSVSETPTSSVTVSSTVSSSPSPSETPTGSPSLTPTKTPSQSPTSSVTVSATVTVSASISFTTSVTPTSTNTPTNSISLTPTFSPSKTPTSTLSPSSTTSSTPTFTVTPSLSPSSTLSLSASTSQTITLSNTPTSSQSLTPSVSSSLTVTISSTSTPSSSATSTPSESPSSSITPPASATPTNSQSNSPTVSFSESLTISPSETPTSSTSVSSTTSNTLSPSISLSLSESVSLSETPTSTPSGSVTASVTSSVTVSETLTSTPSLTASNSPSLTLSATTSQTTSITTSFSPTTSLSSSSSETATISTSLSVSCSITPTTSLSPTTTSSASLSGEASASITETPSNAASSLTVSSPISSTSDTPSASPSRLSSSVITPSKTRTKTKTKTPKSTPKSTSSTPKPTHSLVSRVNVTSIKHIESQGCLSKPEKCPVQSSNFTFTEENVKTNVSIPIFGKGGVLWGEAIVPPNTFPPGCQIHVSQGEGVSRKKNSEEDDDCTEEGEEEGDDKLVTPVSNQLNLTLHSCGSEVREERTFRNPIELRIIAKFLTKERSLESCIGYVQEKEDDWKCQEVLDIFDSTESAAIFSTYVNHFTSFAVLLYPSSEGTGAGCGWGWISITSIVLIGSSILVTLFIILIYAFSPAFRGIITGEHSLAVKKAQLFASRIAEKQVVDEESFLSLTMPIERGSSQTSVSPMVAPTIVTFGTDGDGVKQGPRTIILDN